MTHEIPAWLTMSQWSALDETERGLVMEAQAFARQAIREGAMAQAIEEFPITIPMPSGEVIDETLREAFQRNLLEQSAKMAMIEERLERLGHQTRGMPFPIEGPREGQWVEIHGDITGKQVLE